MVLGINFVKYTFLFINTESILTLVISFYEMTYLNISRSFYASFNLGLAGKYNQPLRQKVSKIPLHHFFCNTIELTHR